MARSNRSRTIATFSHPVTVEVRAPDFEPLAATSHLDFNALRHVDHAQIELGLIHTGCCRSLLRADVEKGMVTALAVEPCNQSETIDIPPELAEVLDIA
jgi:hypothetical protein